jgi:hypothetical protein
LLNTTLNYDRAYCFAGRCDCDWGRPYLPSGGSRSPPWRSTLRCRRDFCSEQIKIDSNSSNLASLIQLRSRLRGRFRPRH